MSDYTISGSSHSGSPIIKQSRRGELVLINAFAWLGALTLCQLEEYIFTEDIKKDHLSQLRQNGYVDEIEHADSGKVFYALSKKGTEVFRREKSKKIMKRIDNMPPLTLGCDESLKQMKTDIKGYEHAMTVGLLLYNSENSFVRTKIMRLHQDELKPGVMLMLIDNSEVTVMVLCVRKSDGVALYRTEYSESTLEHDDEWEYFVKISDDQSQFSCYDSEMNAVDMDTMILQLMQTTDTNAAVEPEDAAVEPEDAAAEPEDAAVEPMKEVEHDVSDGAEHEPIAQELKPVGAETEPDTCDETPVERTSQQTAPDLNDPFGFAKQMLDNGITPQDTESFDALLTLLLESAADALPEERTDYIGRAVMLLKALAFADKEKYAKNYMCLLTAVDMPYEQRVYSTDELSNLFTDEDKGTACHFAALLRALFLPDSQYDFDLSDYTRKLLDEFDEIFPAYSALKGVLDVFSQIASKSREGFTDSVISRFAGGLEKQNLIKQITNNAAGLVEPPRINQRFNGVIDMMSECFGIDSQLGLCMSYISNNNIEQSGFVTDVYNEFSDNGKASAGKIDAYIDEAWRTVRNAASGKWVKDKEFHSVARQKTIKSIHQRLETISRWLSYTDMLPEGKQDKLQAFRPKVMDALRSAEDFLAVECTLPKSDRAVLKRAVHNLSARIKGEQPVSFLPEDWLSTGIFPLDDGMPLLDETFSGIRYFEPWRNVLRHIAERPDDLHNVLKRIETPGDSLYDNLGHAILICEYIGEDEERYRKSIKNARDESREKTEDDFLIKLGHDFAYGRVDEQTRETVINNLEMAGAEFIERGDFAELRVFLAALRRTLDDKIAENRAIWESAIQSRENSEGNRGFLEQARHHLANENSNFTLVEEALYHFDSNADINALKIDASIDDLLSEFISDDNYNALERLCNLNRSNAFRNFALRYVKSNVGLSSMYQDSAQKLVSNLPNEPKEPGEVGIKTMLSEMGFGVSKVKRDNPNAPPSIFTATVEPEGKNKGSYSHPLAYFGTQMENTLKIVVLYGKMEPRSIIETVRRVDSRQIPLVFLNGFLTRAQRRQLARYFLKDGNAQTPFILVDWILLLHLALKVKEERIRVLLACSAPYTGIKQIFSTGSVTQVADEMYIGRLEQIQSIIDVNGPVIVYGGRQLGKTSLLERAKNLFHAPEHDHYGVYADVKICNNEATFCEAVCAELAKAGIKLSKTKAIKELCDELHKWLGTGSRRLLLLIDESDNILSAMAGEHYAALTAFETLSRRTGRFKFVFAGLHNVFLAANDPNTIFGHFGKPICIRPLSSTDAFRLLSWPLKYLGFSINQDVLQQLLVNTMFYPGVIHFAGAKIIDMLIYSYANHYSDNSNPPYQLEDRQIASIMHSSDLSNLIEERIRWTLEADISYLMLARCLAVLYYEEPLNRSSGYSIEMILEYADILEINILRGIGKEKCAILLSEMRDMSILAEMSGNYRFRQTRLLKIIGKSTEHVLEQIEKDQNGGAK